MDTETVIYIQAYNAEKVLHRSLESILAQTCGDYICWVCDNGSTDGTMEIIERYAHQDRRIIPFSNEKNDTQILFDRFIPTLIKDYGDEARWFCNLDADDEYAPDFLEKMLAFADMNRLDVASCGTDWIDERTREIVRHKTLDRDMILEGCDFAEQFPVYRNFMVTIWGAVYSLDLLKRCDFEWPKKAMNFGDTAFAAEAFRRANRAGILAESLHKYYIMPETESYRFNPCWFQACKYLLGIYTEYLLDCGVISRRNENYLYILLLILIKYILPRIQKADVNNSEKLKSLNEIFTDEMTQYLLKHWEGIGIYSDKEEFLSEINDWIKTQAGWEKEHLSERLK